MRASTLVGLVVIVALAAGATVGGAYLFRRRLPNGGEPRPMDARFDEAFGQQRARAAELGFTELRGDGSGDVSVGRGTWSREVDLAAGECGAFLLGPAACARVTEVSIRNAAYAPTHTRSTIDAAYSEGDTPRVVQLQWCAWESPMTVSLTAEVVTDHGCLPEHRSERRLRWEVRRGPADAIAGPDALRTHGLSAIYRSEGRAAAARGWLAANPGEGTPRGEPRELRFDGGAVLRPVSAATCYAVYALANEGASDPIHPALDLPPDAPACPPDGTGASETIDPVRRAGQDAPERILAVVDRGALGAPCVEVELARLRRGPLAPEVTAHEVAPGTDRALPAVPGAGFVHRDRACPARGVVAYLVPATDHADYQLSVRAIEAPEGPVAEAAPTPEGPFPTEDGADPALAARERSCQRGRDASACLELAHDHRQAREGLSRDLARATALYRRACELGSAEGCTYYAHALDAGEGVAEDDDEAERRYRRACQRGHAVACAYVGDIERRTAGAPAAAMRRARDAYATACSGGVQQACENRDLLEELNLL